MLKPSNAAEAAERLAGALSGSMRQYAIGGAIALGFWAQPRGTMDVDLTLFVEPNSPGEIVWALQEIGCSLSATTSTESLNEHGFCRVAFEGIRVDVFMPTIKFYEAARQRIKKVRLGAQQIAIWDAESLCVFKMMFFRRKDLADVEQILRTQGSALDLDWVRDQLATIYGERDPRLPAWDEIQRDVARDSIG